MTLRLNVRSYGVLVVLRCLMKCQWPFTYYINGSSKACFIYNYICCFSPSFVMYFLAKMTDTVRLDPSCFAQDYHEAIADVLNRKLSNKVVLGVGLCVCLFDFEKILEPYVIPGDGASHSKVHFRYVVFRPFIDEVIQARIKTCTRDGINLAMEFFDDIFVPDTKLPENCRFNENEQLWVWEYEADGNVAELFLEPGSQVRFRVTDETFTDSMPTGPEGMSEELGQPERNAPSYAIRGSMAEAGLGCLDWWK